MQPQQDSGGYTLNSRPPYEAAAMGVQPLPRDSRGSLEVFNPVGYSSSSSQTTGLQNFPRGYRQDGGQRAGSTEESGEDGTSGIHKTASGKVKQQVDRWNKSVSPGSDRESTLNLGKGTTPGIRRHSEEITKEFMLGTNLDIDKNKAIQADWPVGKQLALGKKDEKEVGIAQKDNNGTGKKETGNRKILSEAGIAERAAEWGLVVKTNVGEGKGPSVGTRTSGEERRSGGSFQRASATSVRTSEESDISSDTVSHIPRVSKDLRDALETFQQTFVVSDATRPDYPILYASAGFFKMTGYSSKEVIGRNCRFLQGADTDPADVAKIRESLAEGKNYCGRLLNYKKDGTAFWNLLTIAPIKDEEGNILKFIGMQVEVSKHTEGYKDKAMRPNGLPESLIRYDARQKDRAAMDVTELLQAVRHPQPVSTNHQQAALKSPEGGLAILPVAPQGIEQPVFKSANRRGSQTMVRTENTGHGIAAPVEGIPKRHRSSGFRSLIGLDKFGARGANHQEPIEFIEPEILMTRDEERHDSLDELDDKERLKEIRRGIDLATTLERIEKNFVITDPRLPDNPIIFASDSFLELTEYTREEILGRNCRFLQGADTDQETVTKIRDAIREQRDVTVQLLNYTKSGKRFWNLFHLQPMRDQKGELQYFIGVQLDGSEQLEPIRKRLSEKTEKESAKIVRATAVDVDEAVRELPDANLTPDDLWANHSKTVLPKPHKMHNELWKAIQMIRERGEKIGLKHFRPLKPLGFGDTGSVHLVELRGSGELFAMKAMDKSVMLNRNKVHRACAEREILAMLDHPFLPTLYASFQTKTHVCLITDFFAGGELFLLLDRQPLKVFREDTAKFYVAEVIVALEYLHCQGIVYRDLKPENVLLQKDGHVSLTDFDLSFLTSCKPQLIRPAKPTGKRRKQKPVQPPFFVAEPVTTSNSFVGTEEYIAPEVITGAGHSSAVDWWAVGILLYEMIYGRTPFRGKNRQKTFANVLHKDLTFPSSIPASLAARQLINGLLHRDPANRLGSQSGAHEIKKHPFFRGINWPLIRCMTPPPLDAPLACIGKDPDADTKEDLEWDEFEASTPFTSDVF
uniref:non-specific serine/threonine protein kinase n=2 Tax=Osmunda TaxID=3283 RepID=A0A126X2F5_9MONI|nr:phototropin [Osmunda regalis]AML78893.1 putative LOV domain-containing protein [Osmunda sp. BC-2016]